MLQRFRAFFESVISPVAKLLLRLGVTPNQVTVLGTLGTVASALWFVPRGDFLLAVIVVTAFAFTDLVDGHMARISGKTSKWGAFLDSSMDRLGDAAIFGGFVLYYAGPQAVTATASPRVYIYVSLACLVFGSLTSYVRARAESLGMEAKVGIAERAERLVLIGVATLVNAVFDLPIATEIALWLLMVAAAVTVIQRMNVVRKQALGA